VQISDKLLIFGDLLGFRLRPQEQGWRYCFRQEMPQRRLSLRIVLVADDDKLLESVRSGARSSAKASAREKR
jgi:DUF1365 family protein